MPRASTSVPGWLRTGRLRASLLGAALLGAGLLWGAWSLGVEVLHAYTVPPPSLQAPPSHWTLRAAAAGELEAFLHPLDHDLPRRSRIAVATRGLPESEDYFLSLWAAYHLPRHDVVRAVHRRLLQRADYLLLYRSSLEDFGEEATAAVFAERPVLVAEHPAGTLYRIRRP